MSVSIIVLSLLWIVAVLLLVLSARKKRQSPWLLGRCNARGKFWGFVGNADCGQIILDRSSLRLPSRPTNLRLDRTTSPRAKTFLNAPCPIPLEAVPPQSKPTLLRIGLRVTRHPRMGAAE